MNQKGHEPKRAQTKNQKEQEPKAAHTKNSTNIKGTNQNERKPKRA